jgi:hypothetical protein
MSYRGYRNEDDYEDARREAAYEREQARRSTCHAPSCRCDSPCDAYYGNEEEQESEYEECPHCYHDEAWPRNESVEYQICCKCERGALVETLTRSTQHRARKAFPDEKIEPGDLYQRDVVGGYEVNGPRWLTVRRRVVKKGGDLEKLAAAKYTEKEMA